MRGWLTIAQVAREAGASPKTTRRRLHAMAKTTPGLLKDANAGKWRRPLWLVHGGLLAKLMRAPDETTEAVDALDAKLSALETDLAKLQSSHRALRTRAAAERTCDASGVTGQRGSC